MHHHRGVATRDVAVFRLALVSVLGALGRVRRQARDGGARRGRGPGAVIVPSLQQQVDKLPLANAILPEAEVVEKKAVSQDINDWQSNLMTSMKDFSENFITFRSRDGEVIPLLSPEQHFYLRENIKGKLETAIRAVYKEQGEVYSAALKTANEWSKSYLNQDDNSVIEFEKAIKQLSEQNITVKYPVKLESQNQLSDVIRERLRREVTVMTSEEK